MTPEELSALIEKLKNENALALTTIDELMQKRETYASMSVEERNIKKDDISKLDNDIDTLMKNIENRNKEIERYDKLLSLQTKSSMNKRNVADNLDNSSNISLLVKGPVATIFIPPLNVLTSSLITVIL